MRIKVTVEITPEDDAFGNVPECLNQVIVAEAGFLNPEDTTPQLNSLFDRIRDTLPPKVQKV